MGSQLILAHSERTREESASFGLGGKGCIDGYGGTGICFRLLLRESGKGISERFGVDFLVLTEELALHGEMRCLSFAIGAKEKHPPLW